MPKEVISSRSIILLLEEPNFGSTDEGSSCPRAFLPAKSPSLIRSSENVTLIGIVARVLFLSLGNSRFASLIAPSGRLYPTEVATLRTRSPTSSSFVDGKPRITILLVSPALARRSTSSSS
uniref:(northern house mosquito) hypothetical protein n=1 Tax=Culex pipiens TaxID=7175 RepID=A0A8D8PFT8_CULPI